MLMVPNRGVVHVQELPETRRPSNGNAGSRPAKQLGIDGSRRYVGLRARATTLGSPLAAADAVYFALHADCRGLLEDGAKRDQGFVVIVPHNFVPGPRAYIYAVRKY